MKLCIDFPKYHCLKNTNMKDIILKISQKGLAVLGFNKKKELVGIITDGDLRRNMSDKIFKKNAVDVMTLNPKTIVQNKYLKDAMEIFNKDKITVLFVLKNSSSKIPIGIIHLHDCIS